MKMIAKVLDYQSKQVTYNCYVFLKKRKQIKGTREHNLDINLIDTVADATGLSKSTVTRIVRQGNAILRENPDKPVIFPTKAKVKHIRAKRIALNDKTECILRRKVIQFYSTSNEVPSIKKLNNLLKEEGILNCSNEYLRQLVHKLGFTNTDENSSGRLKESLQIVKERLDYVKAIRNCKDNGKNIFFLNETKRWNDDDCDVTSNNVPSFIMVHVSGPEGFLDGLCVMLKLKPCPDFDKKFEHFQNYDWVKDTVIPNLPPAAVIVLNMPQCESHMAIENDPKPHITHTRASIESWMNRNNVYFTETDSKAQLIQRIEDVEANLQYSITKLFAEHKYEMLFLPEKYQDLNPIAIMWDKIQEVEKGIVDDLIMSYPKEKWEECFKKVMAHEDEYYNHDSKVDFSVKEIKKEKNDSESDEDQDQDSAEEDNDSS